jgi:hypothetical protein
MFFLFPWRYVYVTEQISKVIFFSEHANEETLLDNVPSEYTRNLLAVGVGVILYVCIVTPPTQQRGLIGVT